MAGIATLEFAPIAKPLSELQLDAVDLDVTVVRGSVPVADYTSTREHLTVTFAEPLAAGKRCSLEIEYTAEPREGLYFRTPELGYPRKTLTCYPRRTATGTTLVPLPRLSKRTLHDRNDLPRAGRHDGPFQRPVVCRGRGCGRHEDCALAAGEAARLLFDYARSRLFLEAGRFGSRSAAGVLLAADRRRTRG